MPSEVPLVEVQGAKTASRSLSPGTQARFRELFVQGVTAEGKAFRPSDWAERLCGVLSSYRPEPPARSRGAHLGYSPYARPVVVGGLKCVVIDERLREIEPMAFDFVVHFARDNDLPVVEACSMPEAAPAMPDSP